MPFSLALFDLDGTVLDTLDDLSDSVNASLRAFHLAPRSRLEIRSFLGNGLKNLIDQSVPAGTDDDLAAQVLTSMRRIYGEHCADKTRPYDGIPELLGTLRAGGIAAALVSNKPDSAVQRLASDYFTGLFDYCAGEKEGIRRKPAPDMVLAALEALGIAPGSAVYIGDSEVDVSTARNTGLPCIAVTWGFRDRDVLAALEPDFIADRPEELLSLICG